MKNTLQSSNFRFDLSQTGNKDDIKSFLWQIVDVSTPSITVSETSVAIPKMQNLRQPGNALNLGDIDIEFLMDEKFEAYTNIYTWLKSALIVDNPDNYTREGLLMILNSTTSDIITAYKFYDMFPTTLSPLTFTYGESGAIDAVTCNVTFSFSSIDLLDGDLNPI